ncbi:hypothetical protein [Chitinophaga sp. MM2321]|uniref:hypothetical protein n=1 Tax=Chitinophaga sp. MM2321 TaxID=3137178 RepID=UPI0032D5840E
MQQTATPVKKKLTWNKHQFAETVLYLRVFMTALNKALPTNERQTLYMIAKLFTDATVEVNSNRFRVAQHLFERGERYLHALPDEKVMLKSFLVNVYDRSKSLYHHRTGDVEKAISLIHHTLNNNRKLEAQGFHFLLFDRLSQYQNLSRVYFSAGKKTAALEMLSDCLVFLLTGQATLLADLNDHYVKEYDADMIEMRHSLICQLLFETTHRIQQENDAVQLAADCALFFEPMLQSIHRFMIRKPEEALIKQWLEIIPLFYRQQSAGLHAAVAAFGLQADAAALYKGIPYKLLEQFTAG